MLLEVNPPLAVACAFSPCHITGFYHKMLNYSSDLESGSIGAGISLTEGVNTKVTVYEATPKITYDVSINGIPTETAMVSKKVISEFIRRVKGPLHVSVCHETKVPVGFGLGTSGAAALSLAISLNEVLGAGLSVLECAQVAHCAELYCKTGLGTVISEFTGGLELRTTPGAPGIGSVEKIPIHEMSVVAICLSPIRTSQAIACQEDRMTMKTRRFLDILLRSKSVDDFLRLSYEFSLALKVVSGRCKSLIEILRSNGFMGSMALFGETVFTIAPNDEIKSVLRILNDYKSHCIVASVDNVGARLLKTP
jgi:pantoate kinase